MLKVFVMKCSDLYFLQESDRNKIDRRGFGINVAVDLSPVTRGAIFFRRKRIKLVIMQENRKRGHYAHADQNETNKGKATFFILE